MSDYFLQNLSICSFRNSDSWVVLTPIELSIKQKIEAIGTPLKDWDVQINYGIKTGFNNAFIVDGKKRAELIEADPKSAEIIRPILRGRDIKRYNYEFADLWLINTHNGVKDKGVSGINIDDYPSIKMHLDKYWDNISVRADKGDTPYNLRNCAYMDDFNKQKIVWGNLNLKASFTHAPEGVYINAPAAMIVPYDKSILAMLNSKLSDYYIRNLGVARNGGYFEYKPMFIEKLPIPNNIQSSGLDILIDQQLNGCNVEDLIDQRIYELFGLSAQEIEIVEGN